MEKKFRYFFSICRRLLFLFFWLSISSLYCQNNIIKGKVIDAKTKEPLAFVNIIIDKNNVVTTDIDGSFVIKEKKKIDSVRISYLGYKPMVYYINSPQSTVHSLQKGEVSPRSTVDGLQKSKIGRQSTVDSTFNKSVTTQGARVTNARQQGTQRVSDIIIELEREEINLPEVTILPGVNPALRIINNVINNREINNPERLEAFSYNSYNKMVFTVDVDSIRKKNIEKLDYSPSAHEDSSLSSSDRRLIEAMNSMYLFLIESVAEHKFVSPDKHYEKVIANKTSGIQEPLLVMLASQYQSFSFYNDYVKIAEKPYLNPLTRGSINKYIYILKDTLYKDKDTIYIISFQPKKNKTFDGLTGVLYINTNRYAIQNVIAKPADEESGMKFRIQQQYELIDNIQWFPIQLSTEIEFNNLKVNKSNVVAKGNTYIRDIVFFSQQMNEMSEERRVESEKGINNNNQSISDSLQNNKQKIIRKWEREMGNTSFEVMPDAADKKEDYWKMQRKDSITKKELKTYKVIDSLGKDMNLDRITKNLENILLGKVSYKFIDFEIGRFINFSDYEGYMLGLGLETNNKISKWFRIGGYYSYAFRLNSPTYGGHLSFLIDRKSDFKLRFSYLNDYEETGGHRFFDDSGELLNPENFKDLLILHKDKIERKEISVGFRTMKYMNVYAGMSDTKKEITNEYRFGFRNENATIKLKTFDITELTLGLRYAYNEKFMKTAYYTISTGTDYPIIWLQYKRGFNNFLNGYFEYNRYDVKVKKDFDIRNAGKSSIEIEAGYIDNNIPLTNLYNGTGTYRSLTIYAPNSFATMRFNEFYADKYLNIYFTHSFGNLLIKTKKFKPEFVIASNLGYGSINDKEKHYDMNFSTAYKGYFESGLLINNLIKMKFYTIGAGCFYRYGYYQFDKVADNLAAKLTLVFPLLK